MAGEATEKTSLLGDEHSRGGGLSNLEYWA